MNFKEIFTKDLNESEVALKDVVIEVSRILTSLTGKQWGAQGGNSGCSWNIEKITLKNPGRLKSFKMKGFNKKEEMQEIIVNLGKKYDNVTKAIHATGDIFAIKGTIFEIIPCGKSPDIMVAKLDDQKYSAEYFKKV